MVNPVDIGLRIAQALDSIGIKMGSYIGKSSNIKKAMFGGKPTMFKPNALEALRGTGSNFDDALRLIEEESKFIVNATDAEKMAFLNNVNDYKEFGGPLKKDVVARTEFEQGLGSLKGDIEDLQSSTKDLLTTAKTMKDDAEKGLKSAEDDLKTFLETGGNPLKKKEPKYLGGSMHEEGQLRTAIRTFLKNEFKNGRIKLDETDKFRVMEYSPMMEDDPIKVFKKIYGDEAYKRAGTFPGAFETGESFNHYESIFRSKMGEDILKVKDKKYVGDGTLLLTDEVITPTPDDDVPFAKGGRAGFAGGGGLKRIVQEIIEYITTKFTPMDAMKEVNKVVGKTGKYKNLKLTDDDINDIVEGSNDFIFQRDPDNLFVEGSIKERTEYLDDADKAETFFPKTSINKSVDDMSIEESLTTLEGLGGTKMAERFRLKQKYPGLDDDLLTNIIEDTDPVHKASVLAKIDMAMELGKTNKSAEEIIDILKKEPETKMATGGRAGYSDGNIVYEGEGPIQFDLPFGEPMFTMKMNGRLFGIYKNKNGSHLSVPLGSDGKPNYAKGGRAGYYGGGQATVEPDLSDIGHGSDSLMARTRITAPGSQATTSTGLNYLLGEDNDNVRVPFEDGLLVPPKKPYTEEMFEDDSMTLLKGMYGTGSESNPLFYNKIIEKGNMLREQGVERETVIEIIRKNKNKINAFLETQTTSPKSFEGLESFEMKADGGRIGYASKGKVSLSDLESLKGLKKSNTGNEGGLGGIKGPQQPSSAQAQRNKIKNKVISSFIYAVDNMDQETSTYVKDLFNGALQVGYETDTSGIKTDIFEKTGIVPINSETIYNTIVNLDLPKEITAKMSAISDKAGNKELSASLKKNNMGITWDDQSQEIKADYIFTLGADGDTKIQPMITKDADSQISKEVKIDQAIGDGTLNFTLNESDIDNASGSSINYKNDSISLFADKKSDDYDNTAKFGGTVDIPFYLLNNEEKPYISAEINKNLDTGFESKKFSAEFPLTDNLKLWGDRYEDDQGDSNNTNYGLGYYKQGDIGEMGNWFVDAGIDKDKDWSANVGFSFPFGKPEKKAFNYSTNNLEEAYNMYKDTDGFKYEPKPPRMFAEGGVAGLRQGYVGGGGVNLARRGFLKVLGGTVGAIAAFKTGALKLLGKSTTKAAPKLFTAAEGSGAPAWFEGMVNKVLADGVDITKKAATMDGQTVKSLDTPTGKVDVTIDRTGNIDVNYMGDNTAMGEGVDMRYTVGQADETTKVKPADEFEAVETIPEGRMYSPNDYQVEFGENATDQVKNLYSDVSELQTLGGDKRLINDISVTLQKKKTLKKMNENPDQFASDNLPDDYPNYDYEDINPDYD